MTNGNSTDTLWDGVPIEGAVTSYHPDHGGYPFSRQIYESAPTQRVVKLGQPGLDFAITQQGNPHITTISYGTNSDTTTNFLYALPANQYLVTTSTDPDGNITTSYMDVMQKAQQEEAKKNGQDIPNAQIGVIQTSPSADAQIQYSWVL